MPFFADLVLSLMNVVYQSMQLLEERNKPVFEQSNYVKADSPPVFLLVIFFTQVNSCAGCDKNASSSHVQLSL